jgi:hypothetical protein
MRCPDCESLVVTSIPERGNGKCSNCHGRGTTNTIANDISGSGTKCPKCNGTGACQTCNGSGEAADTRASNTRPHAAMEENPFDDKIAVRVRCPKCGEIDWFEWKFLGKLTDPVCGHSWYVSTGVYALQQVRATFSAMGKGIRYMNKDVHGQGAGIAKVLGVIGGASIGFAFRLPYALIMIPIQAAVSLSKAKNDPIKDVRKPVAKSTSATR